MIIPPSPLPRPPPQPSDDQGWRGGLQWRDTHDTLRRDYAVITEEELKSQSSPDGPLTAPSAGLPGHFFFFFSLRSLSKNNHPNKLSTLSLEKDWMNKGWDGVSGSARGREEGSEAEGFWWSFLLWKSIRWKGMDPALITVVHYNMSSRALMTNGLELITKKEKRNLRFWRWGQRILRQVPTLRPYWIIWPQNGVNVAVLRQICNAVDSIHDTSKIWFACFVFLLCFSCLEF